MWSRTKSNARMLRVCLCNLENNHSIWIPIPWEMYFLIYKARTNGKYRKLKATKSPCKNWKTVWKQNTSSLSAMQTFVMRRNKLRSTWTFVWKYNSPEIGDNYMWVTSLNLLRLSFQVHSPGFQTSTFRSSCECNWTLVTIPICKLYTKLCILHAQQWPEIAQAKIIIKKNIHQKNYREIIKSFWLL